MASGILTFVKIPDAIVNFEHISHLVLVFFLLTLNMFLPAGSNFNDLFVFNLETNFNL